jgi:hypothetical protein
MGNFARCLKRDGALYLGVNGSSHVSVRLRRALPLLGQDLDRFEEGPAMRQALRLCDSATAVDRLPQLSGFFSSYLASDVYGGLNRCLTLGQWIQLGRGAGLSFRGNWASIGLFRNAARAGSHSLLIPRSRADTAKLLELLCPTQFHRLLFSKTPEANPPWERRKELLDWRVQLTRFHKLRLPRPGRKVLDRLRPVTIRNRELNLAMEYQMPDWEIELLRGADGNRSLGQYLRGLPLSVPFGSLQSQLYLLHQLGVISLLRPGAPR